MKLDFPASKQGSLASRNPDTRNRMIMLIRGHMLPKATRRASEAWRRYFFCDLSFRQSRRITDSFAGQSSEDFVDPESPVLVSPVASRETKERKLTIETSSLSPRVKILINTIDSESGERVVRSPAKSDEPAPSTGGEAFILKKKVHSRFSSEANSDETSEIDIQNPDLWVLLKKHLEHYPYHIFRGSPVTLYSPYESIIYEWDVLQQAAKQSPTDERDRRARDDLKLLLETIGGGSCGDPKLDKYFKMRESYIEQKSIQFQDLWTIFPPGTLIYGRPFQDQDQLFIVKDNIAPWPRRGDRPQNPRPWDLECWTYDWDGTVFQRTAYEVSLPHFDGLQPLVALPFFPFDVHPDRKEVAQSLVERGKRFRHLCQVREGERLFEYSGEAIFEKGSSDLTHNDDVSFMVIL